MIFAPIFGLRLVVSRGSGYGPDQIGSLLTMEGRGWVLHRYELIIPNLILPARAQLSSPSLPQCSSHQALFPHLFLLLKADLIGVLHVAVDRSERATRGGRIDYQEKTSTALIDCFSTKICQVINKKKKKKCEKTSFA